MISLKSTFTYLLSTAMLLLSVSAFAQTETITPTLDYPDWCVDTDKAEITAHEVLLFDADSMVIANAYIDAHGQYTSDATLLSFDTDLTILATTGSFTSYAGRTFVNCTIGCCTSAGEWRDWLTVDAGPVIDEDGDGTPAGEDDDDNDPCVTPNYDVICPDSEQDCDGGSVPDCVEIANGTDPNNPDDDVTDVAIDTNDDLGNGGETGVTQTVDVTGNDTDSNCAPITYVVTTTINCTVVNNGDGTFDVTPTDGDNWDFTYTATCDDGTTSDTSDVSGKLMSAINITTADDSAGEAPLDVYTQVDVTDNDSSNNCEPITYVVSNEVNCTVINNGDGTFAVKPIDNTPWSFDYTATCSDGSTSDTATVNGTSFGAANNGACPTVEGGGATPVKAVDCTTASSAYTANFQSIVDSAGNMVYFTNPDTSECAEADPNNLSNGTNYTFWFGSIPNDNYLLSIDFGDGSNVYAYDSSSGGNFTHSYTSTGSYTINIYSYCDGSLIGTLNVVVV